MSGFEELIGRLDAFIRRYYKNRLLKGLILTSAIMLSAFLLVITLEHFGRYNSGSRTIIFYSYIIGLTAIAVPYIFIPLVKLARFGKIISYEQAAVIIGRHFPEIKDKLLNALQLHRQSESESTSNDLLLAGIEQKIQAIRPIPIHSAVNFKENVRYLKFAIPPILILLIIMAAKPSMVSDSTRRLMQHRVEFIPPPPFEITIENENLKAMQNEDYELVVQLRGSEIPAELNMELNGNRQRMRNLGKGKFAYTFRNVQENIRWNFSALDYLTSPYELSVVPRPFIIGYSIYVDYPQYTGLSDGVVENRTMLEIPAGTKLHWKFEGRNTDELSLKTSLFDTTLFAGSQGSFELKAILFGAQRWVFKAANSQAQSPDSLVVQLNVLPDAYPAISVAEQRDEASGKILHFTGQASDDYGLSRLQFVYRFTAGEKKNADPNYYMRHTIPLSDGGKSQQFYHLWDLNELGVAIGDELEYFFEVWDNDGIRGSKSSRSTIRVFKAPDAKAIEQANAESSKALKSDITKTLNDFEKIKKSMQEFQKKMLDKPNMNWEDRKELEKILEQQKQVEQQIEQLKDDLKKLNRQESEYKQIDPEIMKKQKELQKLFDEVLSPEMKEMIRQLEQMLMEKNKDQIQKELQKVDVNNKEVERELDRMLQLYKELELEKNLQDWTEKMKELSEKQKELSEKSTDKGQNKEELKKQQDEIKKEFKELEKQLEKLQQQNSELDRPMDMKEEKNDEQMKDIENEMQGGNEMLDKNNRQGAQQKQKKAAEKMEEMAAEMQSMMQENEEQENEENIRTLREILSNLVYLSQEQERVMESLKSVRGYSPQLVKAGQEQRDIKDKAKVVEDSLYALARRVAELESFITREMTSINANMEMALQGFGERNIPYTRSRQQMAMTAMNNLAVMLSEILKNMQDDANAKSSGGAQCKKPKKGKGNTPGKPSLSKMREMQQNLQRQLDELQKGSKGDQKGQGQNPGGVSSEQWAKMAAQQQALRQMLNDLEKELKKDGNGGKLGDLGKTQKLMEEVEKDLVNKRLNLETLKRQKEIETRLLEHERAEREREMDNKRESREGKQEDREIPPQLKEYLKAREREAELLRTLPPDLQPYYRDRVRGYFRLLGEME